MSFNRSVSTYVAFMVIAALSMLAYTSTLGPPPIDAWALFSLVLVGFLLEVSGTRSTQGGVGGSLVFVFHLAVGLVLGGMWGGLAAGVVKMLSQAYQRTALMKAVFNTAERVLSVTLTFSVYHWLGGKNPPLFLRPEGSGAPVSFEFALQEVAIYLASAVVYFIVNSVSVNTVVALASKRPLWSTWSLVTTWQRVCCRFSLHSCL